MQSEFPGGPAAMTPLPDPRRYGNGEHLLARLAAAARGAGERSALAAAVRETLERGDSAALRAALAAAPGSAAYAALSGAIAEAVDVPAADPDTVALRFFAIPLVIVAGARGPAQLVGALPDAAEIAGLLEQHGALGPTRNFGLSNALVEANSLDGLDPVAVRGWALAGAPREWNPAPVAIAARGEEVHLRFLVGAGLTAAGAPAFIETGANVAAWGMPVTRALAAQLRAPGIEVLPLPRPPARLLAAVAAGRQAQLAAAFDLFASNALRRFRMSVGDPAAVVSAHETGEIRVTFSSPLDESLHDGFRWPLHPAEDLAAVAAGIDALFRECRIGDVRVVGRVLPDLSPAGVPWFPRAAEAERLGTLD